MKRFILMIGLALVASAWSIPNATAGSITVHNKNCGNPDVHIQIGDPNQYYCCTHGSYLVRKDDLPAWGETESKTYKSRIDVKAYCHRQGLFHPKGKDFLCTYNHYARGMLVINEGDINGNEDTSVTCQLDGALCRCKKD